MARTALLLLLALLQVQAASRTNEPESSESGVTPRDNAVMLVVLERLLAEGKMDPFVPPGDPSKPLLFDLEPICNSVTADQVLEPSDEKEWEGLTDAEQAAVREAAENLVARAKSCAGEFTISHPRIQLRRGDPPGTGIFDRTSAAFLPGFSRDGRTALVLLSIPWSIHGASGTHVLVLQDGEWQIRVRDFAYYL